MKLPGPLIEYIINGSVAMIWIYPLIKKDIELFDDNTSLVLVPIVYVIGMFIDLLAFGISRWAKLKLRSIVEKKYLGKTKDYYPGVGKVMRISIITKFPELAKEIEMRSGRDRIARGMIVNSIFFMACSTIVPLWLSSVILGLSIVMWVAFEVASHGFTIHAYQATKDKQNTL